MSDKKSTVEIGITRTFIVTPRLRFFTCVENDPEVNAAIFSTSAYLTKKELLELKEDVQYLLTEINVILSLPEVKAIKE
uniref:Uncharacterized protein n=1 Tax=viral metagenome TaxID=1070528 RepID=A0A6M3L0Y2_9ZZZZ